MVTNEVLNTILSRKGVKQYKSNPVPRELLEAIVAAGIAAPNAFNRQAWHFSVITNKTLLEEIDAETNHRLGDEEGYHIILKLGQIQPDKLNTTDIQEFYVSLKKDGRLIRVEFYGKGLSD